MLIIELGKEKNLDVALKSLKYKVQKTKLVQQLKERKNYEKPSVTKRTEKLKAVYGQKMKNGLN